MKQYFKIISFILIISVMMANVCVFGASADSTYTPPEEFIYGDVDMDGEVTVRDATLVQKGVAGVVYLTAVQRYLAVADSEDFSVRNATAIQKHLAGLDTASSVDEVVKMTYTDKFSNEMRFWEHSETDHIIIEPVNASWEYTLEDFSEYDFSQIKVSVYEFNNIFRKEIILYLSDPGKENIENAIRTLDYRANLDLKYAIVATYDYPC